MTSEQGGMIGKVNFSRATEVDEKQKVMTQKESHMTRQLEQI